MNIMITGGTGFIGSRLALKCLENGHSVMVLGQENNPAESQNKKLLETKGACITLGSVTEKGKLPDLLKGVEVVYHLAAAQHEANVPDHRFWDVNVTGTKNMLEASLKAGVKRFIHGSSIGVYGSALNGKLNEESPVRPDNIYGSTKLSGESTALSFRDVLPVVVIRISETYGPGDRRLLKLFKAIKKRVFFMIGSGTNLHHLVYIDDLIEGLLLTATTDKALGRVFVLAGKEVLSTNDMVAIIGKELGATIPLWRAPLPFFLFTATVMEGVLRPLGVQPPLHRRRLDFFIKSFAFSQDTSEEMLGYQPRVAFEQGVRETAGWYSQMGFI